MVGLHLGQTCTSGVTMTLRPPRLCCFLFIIRFHAVTATLTSLYRGFHMGPFSISAGLKMELQHLFPKRFALRHSVLTYHDTVQLSTGMSPLQAMWRRAHQHHWRSSQPICSSLSQACMSASPTSPLPTSPLPTWSCGAGWSPATLRLPLPLLLPAVTVKVRQL